MGVEGCELGGVLVNDLFFKIKYVYKVKVLFSNLSELVLSELCAKIILILNFYDSTICTIVV